MPNLRKAGGHAAIWLILFALLACGCAGEQIQSRTVDNYMLTDAGFGKLDVNDQTPSRQALYNASGTGRFTTYYVGNDKYYVYIDQFSRDLYVGDEAAYQRYRSMVKDKNLCRTLDATDSAPFWSCFQEFQKSKKPQ